MEIKGRLEMPRLPSHELAGIYRFLFHIYTDQRPLLLCYFFSLTLTANSHFTQPRHLSLSSQGIHHEVLQQRPARLEHPAPRRRR
jgi:hypothetical protein